MWMVKLAHLLQFLRLMDATLGLTPLTPFSAPSSIPSEWNEAFMLKMAQELRARLLSVCADVRTTDSRRDWLLHMALQSHHLPSLVELVSEFNLAQQESPGEGFEELNLQLHDLGFRLQRQSLAHP